MASGIGGGQSGVGAFAKPMSRCVTGWGCRGVVWADGAGISKGRASGCCIRSGRVGGSGMKGVGPELEDSSDLGPSA